MHCQRHVSRVQFKPNAQVLGFKDLAFSHLLPVFPRQGFLLLIHDGTLVCTCTRTTHVCMGVRCLTIVNRKNILQPTCTQLSCEPWDLKSALLEA